jgi:hypothetical protein
VLFGHFGGLAGFFAGYVPGMQAGAFPEGTGKYLPAGQVLTFQMHYITTGQIENDQTRIGLYLLPEPPEATLQTRSAFTIDINIPPGTRDYQREAHYTVTAANGILLHEMSPHMHYRGAWFKYEAIYPDGSSEILLSVPHYHFDWQTLYQFNEPKFLPRDTVIRCVGGFDNSPLNRMNPDPTQTVRFGEQTEDEMFIGYFNYSAVP